METGKYLAYHRTSTKEQHLDRGINEIRKYCNEHDVQLYKNKIYCDQHTGKNFDRVNYKILKELLSEGDTLIVTEVDRLGRNKKDTEKELRYWADQGVRIMFLEIPTTCIDYSQFDNSMATMLLDTVNNLLIELYASIAQAELEKKEKRQKEGIQTMKDRGEWERYGRPRVLKQKDFNRAYQYVVSGTKKPFELIKELGLTKSTYYRYRDDFEKYQNTKIE